MPWTLDLMSTNIELYDKYFTNDEIKGMIQFYESPVGQKAVQVLPAIMQEGMTRGMEQGQAGCAKSAGSLSGE